MRVLIQHRSRYLYPRPALLGPQVIRLRPAGHARARIETYSLTIQPEHRLHWQRDPHGNHVARATFRAGQTTEALDILVELGIDVRPVNPFDFFVDDRAKTLPFSYPDRLDAELAPYLDTGDPAYRMGRRATELLQSLPWSGGTIDVLVELGRAVAREVSYVIRDEPGVWTPEETITNGRGSCRDSAVLLVALMRARGIAARFVSGYLVQLTDEGMIPDEPKGVARDVVDLHAWAEAYVPGAGWIGFDATSGLLCGEGHIPLAATASPLHAAPLEGTSDVAAHEVQFEATLRRLGHEARPTAPYPDAVWDELRAAGERADAALSAAGLEVWVGGEPTFAARERQELPEWQGGALGSDKWQRGRRLAELLRDRLASGGVVLHRMGKHYPGESLPRWALDVIGRRDGAALWPARELREAGDGAAGEAAQGGAVGGATGAMIEVARRAGERIAAALGIAAALHPAYEDPWEVLRAEARLPVDIDPRTAGLGDPEERRRLAAIFDRGAGTPVGWVLPLGREDGSWLTEQWLLRREHLFLLPGDSPLGLRLPLGSVVGGAPPVTWADAPKLPDPRRDEENAAGDAGTAGDATGGSATDGSTIGGSATDGTTIDGSTTAAASNAAAGDTGTATGGGTTGDSTIGSSATGGGNAEATQPTAAATLAPAAPPRPDGIAQPPAGAPPSPGLRTALAIQPRDGQLWVFLPPLPGFADFAALLAALDTARAELGVALHLEGYPPPPSPDLLRFAVTPDPGVLEVNLPPASTCREAIALHETVFDAALTAGLTAERYLLDGRAAGSGGGNHITIGASRPERSPWLVRPELLGSLVTFAQHHPSLAYLFSGLFVGPTSQAPRVDEARHDALYELEIALPRLYEAPPPPAWQVDALLRHLLVDVAGSTHRAELSIDKLFDPQTPYGRQGLVELRAFEMPPHPRMAAAQVVLVRALVAAFASAPYRHPLVRWGSALHDRFLLPYYLWRDFEDVLAYLAARGVALPAGGYRPFIELRCPLVGVITAGDAQLEVRNAIEPWHVLGEEATQTGTARYVDSSVERIELRAIGLPAERYVVAVNGIEVPLREVGQAGGQPGGYNGGYPGEYSGGYSGEHPVRVGGVRFRAWCPPHALHPHLGIHHPLRIEIVDTWAARGVAAGTYHVWHPEGRAFAAPPLTRVEAAARRAQRFTLDGPGPAPQTPRAAPPHPEQPHTLDLRRLDRGAPMPRPADWSTP